MCEEASSISDASKSDGGGVSDEENADLPGQYGVINIYSLPEGKTNGAKVYVDGEAEPRCQTPCENLRLKVGSYDILLSLDGWLQYPNPQKVEVTKKGENVKIQFYRDLTGSRLRQDGTGIIMRVKMYLGPPNSISCPDKPVQAGPFSPLGGVCVEADETLSAKPKIQNVMDYTPLALSSRTGSGWNFARRKFTQIVRIRIHRYMKKFQIDVLGYKKPCY